MVDHTLMKLGVRGFHPQPKRLMAAHALMDLLPPAPLTCDNTKGISAWGMMENDTLGDCTCAGLGHSLQVATLNTGTEVTAPDSVVLSAYENFCGYDPSDPSTDQGGVETDILSDVESQGFNGAKLLGWVSPDPQNLDHVRQAIASFGSLYIGAALPLSSQGQPVWDAEDGPNGTPGSWGGHCVVIPKYDPNMMPVITWGEIQQATVAWWQKYVQECHILLWDCWVAKFPSDTQAQILAVMQSLND